MKILIAGDLFVSDQFYHKDLIDKSVLNLFSHADYRIVNLEAPITNDNKEHKIIKTGPHLRMSEQTAISVLKQLDIDSVTLANNHILDYGTKGLLDTLDILKREKISYVGAGVNLKDASKCITLNKEGIKTAIVNFCENEWSIAEENLPGANPMDIIDNSNQIREAKASHDKVIIIVHGGHEYYNLPSPRMQKQYRFYADQGADLVIGHHTHCISGNEMYKGVPIYYSLGNFLFTDKSSIEDWYTGLVLVLEIKDGIISTNLFPIKNNKQNFQLTLYNGEENDMILRRIHSFNKIIHDENKVLSEWKNYLNEKSRTYLTYWSSLAYVNNRYINAIFRRLNLNIYKKKTLSQFLNLIRCEAHSDMSKEIIKEYIKKII
jgi:poly-gamma-glutamate synthesis protein (capsule biosynthesis protein)